ncbi:methylaspartate ammonia-lyase [Spirochaeta isovalerica]|uniref:methylaspartate ammonia-lyase n=1 Tax=Spirochaeta isovalerica TaxID=150 RepID=A0A841RAU9_9SPIO|nr:methylaspartate ammonia-lyase [Spirochaeta isovalerica]MBB6479808.1 methylaspartate ammonia-lyase [Spirochaeta isovalerica]
MKIVKAIFSPGVTGFFFDDQKAIKAGAEHDGFIYRGEPMTEGFTTIRMTGQSISVQLIMENGQIAVGDCAAVQYSGAGGRDPLFLAETYIPFMEEHIRPWLEGRDIQSFKEAAEEFDVLKVDGERLHTAIRYGVSQALLDAAAISAGLLKQEVVCRDYDLPVVAEPVPLFAQSGDDRYTAVDKMIIKQVDVLPHALINNIDTKLGRKGELLLEYVSWLRNRVEQLREYSDYKPDLHIDVYGTIGIIFDYDADRMADYFLELEKAAGELQLYIEGPMDMGEKARQIAAMKELQDKLHEKGCKVKTVADEWCNTWEDIRDFTDAKCCDMVQIKTPDLGSIHNIVKSILYCKEHGMEAYQGGTCNETNISAQTCVHVGLAARAERMLVKPGMGFDEGLTIVKNEMERTLAVLKYKEVK